MDRNLSIDAVREDIEHHQNPIKDLIQAGSLFAEENTKCKRKGVGVTLLPFPINIGEAKVFTNGPHFNNSVFCTGEVGNCGCVHAEMRALVYALHNKLRPIILLSTYSPCTNCANLIVTCEAVVGVVWKYDTEHDMRGIEILKRVGTATAKLI